MLNRGDHARLSDKFDIPEEEDAKNTNSRAKRKPVKTVAYTDGLSEEESTEGDGSGSEYHEQRKKSLSPAKRHSRITKAQTLNKTVLPSTSKATATVSKTRVSNSATRPASHDAPKPSLLSNLTQKPQPVKRSTRATKASTRKKTGDKKPTSATPDAGSKNTPAIQDDTASPAENSTLEKLISGVDSNDPIHNIAQGQNLSSRKRPAGHGSSLRTPPTKRVKKENIGAATALSTKGPSRVLEDPYSPCGRHSRPIGSLPRQFHDMQPPRKPKGENMAHGLPPTPHRQEAMDGRTPIHKNSRRIHSDYSANLELLSSNSKPTPASPHAESTAISGHADPERVIMEQEFAETEIARSNPFRRSSQKSKVTAFTRRLTGENDSNRQIHGSSQGLAIELGDSSSFTECSPARPPIHMPQMKPVSSPAQRLGVSEKLIPTQARNLKKTVIEIEHTTKKYNSQVLDATGTKRPAFVQHKTRRETNESVRKPVRQGYESKQSEQDQWASHGVSCDGDTLIEEDGQFPEVKGTPIYLRSSPPPFENASPSSHSSTSAEPEPRTDQTIPTSECEEMEWEASLQPHQRALGDQLVRVSNRVLRHIVDNETALDDIAGSYESDGQHLLQNLAHQHDGVMDTMSKEMNKKTDKMRKSCDRLLKKLKDGQEELERYGI